MSNLLGASLEALKNAIHNNKSFRIQRNLGFQLTCTFSFSKPATLKEIEDFEAETDLKLPEDYKFLLFLHNGMELYKDVEESVPHWHIFGIDEIFDALEKYPTPEHVYIIAKFDQTLICVKSDYVKNGRKDYLFDQSIYTSSHNDGDPLHLNFELWLDRLLVSLGDHFWLWNSITPQYRKEINVICLIHVLGIHTDSWERDIMKDKLKGLIVGLTIGSLVAGSTVFAGTNIKINAVLENVKYMFNGVEKQSSQSIIYNGQ